MLPMKGSGTAEHRRHRRHPARVAVDEGANPDQQLLAPEPEPSGAASVGELTITEIVASTSTSPTPVEDR
jgi:hypothetical protein